MTDASVQKYARTTGLLLLVTLVAGSLGEAIIPSRLIVSADPAQTMRNIATHELLFRWGFAAYLVEAFCDVALAFMFYVLLRPVNRNLALLAAFFGLVSTAVFAGAELFYFAPALILNKPEFSEAFEPAQLNALVFFGMKMYAYCGIGFLAFYGIATLMRGYLIYRSTFLPKAIGILLMIGGAAFILRNFTFVLAPSYSSEAMQAALVPGGVALTLWLLIKGVDTVKWKGANASLG